MQHSASYQIYTVGYFPVVKKNTNLLVMHSQEWVELYLNSPIRQYSVVLNKHQVILVSIKAPGAKIKSATFMARKQVFVSRQQLEFFSTPPQLPVCLWDHPASCPIATEVN